MVQNSLKGSQCHIRGIFMNLVRSRCTRPLISFEKDLATQGLSALASIGGRAQLNGLVVGGLAQVTAPKIPE